MRQEIAVRGAVQALESLIFARSLCCVDEGLLEHLRINIAALFHAEELTGDTVICTISGGNVDAEVFQKSLIHAAQ